MIEQLALACRYLVLARRAQHISKHMRQTLESAPANTAPLDDLRRDWATRDAVDQMKFTDALDRVNRLTGSPAVGAVILERTNALIRAEDAKLGIGTARMALTCAPVDALAELINESEAFLQITPGCPVTTAQLERARELLADIRQAGLYHFANLGSLS